MSAVPVLHYFNLGRLGRGEIVRLFLTELGIEYKDELYEYNEEWKTKKDELKLNLTGTLPVLDIDGHRLSQHLPILRYLSRRAGGYDGDSNYEKFLVDAVSDVYIDYRAAWVASLVSGVTDEYKNETAPRAIRVFDSYYKEHSGPFLLGDRITYVDFAVYQILHNDSAAGAQPEIPASLKKLQEAIENRPKLKEFIAKREAARGGS
ncbi:glutathione S-transferase [Sarocladium strictum]